MKKIFLTFILILSCNQKLMALESLNLSKTLSSPWGVVIVAGMGTVFSGILYEAASEQEKESNENIKKIDKLIASFKDSYVAYCPKGRTDLAEPKCYCYTENGQQNPSRTNSKVCTDLWSKNTYVLSGDAANYALAAYNPDVAGCVALNGQFDENCQCKKLVNAKGVNACKKETTLSLPNNNFSTAIASGGGVTDLLKFAVNSTNGNPRFDLINAGSIGAKAIRVKQITDELVKKVPLLTEGKIPDINKSNIDKFAKAILGEKRIEQNSNPGNIPMNVASSRDTSPQMKTLLKEAQKKVGIQIVGTGNGLNAKKEKKKAGFDLNFTNDSSGASSSQILDNFPEQKNYKLKNSDIVTDNSASLFEIISNRYIQSGLKRLFDESGE